MTHHQTAEYCQKPSDAAFSCAYNFPLHTTICDLSVSFFNCRLLMVLYERLKLPIKNALTGYNDFVVDARPTQVVPGGW